MKESVNFVHITRLKMGKVIYVFVVYTLFEELLCIIMYVKDV